MTFEAVFQTHSVAVENERIERHVGADESDIYALGGCRFEYKKESESGCEERGGRMRKFKTTR